MCTDLGVISLATEKTMTFNSSMYGDITDVRKITGFLTFLKETMEIIPICP